MAAQTSIKVAVQTGAAKDDVFNQGQITEDSGCIALNVLANDPGSAKLWSVEQTPLSVNNQVTYYKLDSGAVVSIVNGVLYYDPSGSAKFQSLGAGETCEETFTYTVRMANGALSLATVKVVVGGENDVPVITGPQKSLQSGTEDTGYTVKASDLLAGFSDVDGDTLSVSGLKADHGTVTKNEDGTFTITPAANYNGPVSLSYDVVDGNGGSVATTQSFSLAAVNDPAAIGDPNKANVTEDVGVAAGKLSVSGSIAISDVDGAGEAAFWETVTAAQGTLGTLVLQTDGTYTYSVENNAVQYLNSGQFKTETFTVASVDGTTKSISFTISGADETIKAAPPVVTGSSDPNDTAPVGAVTTATNQGDVLKGTPNNDSLDGLQGGDTIYGLAGNDSILGSQGNDTIYGGSGADQIHGGEGSDIIVGGLGADLLTGGNGADKFVFLDFRDTGDTITDFAVGQDKIAFKAGLGVSFSDLIFTQSDGNTIASVDKPGGSTIAYEMQLTFLGLKSLSAADFDFSF